MTAIKAVVIDNDGDYQEIQLDGLRQMQEIVGGYVEAVGGPDYTLWINEEGKLDGLPGNRLGTELWWHLDPRFVGQDFLCGPVLITGGPDAQGETLPITARVEELLQRVHENSIA